MTSDTDPEAPVLQTGSQAVVRWNRHRAIGAGSIGLAIGLAIGLVGGFLAANASREASNTELSPAPPDISAGRWDQDSLLYVGTFRTATFWAATKEGGEVTCVIVSDPAEEVLSNTTCGNTTSLTDQEIPIEQAFRDPSGEMVRVLFTVRLREEGDFSFTVNYERE